MVKQAQYTAFAIALCLATGCENLPTKQSKSRLSRDERVFNPVTRNFEFPPPFGPAAGASGGH